MKLLGDILWTIVALMMIYALYRLIQHMGATG